MGLAAAISSAHSTVVTSCTHTATVVSPVGIIASMAQHSCVLTSLLQNMQAAQL